MLTSRNVNIKTYKYKFPKTIKKAVQVQTVFNDSIFSNSISHVVLAFDIEMC